jgi:hypothetical protein
MQAILNIEPNEVDEKLLNVIRELLARNVEITIKNQSFELQEFDAPPIEDLMREFQNAGYSEDFLNDLKQGFETSEVYAK